MINDALWILILVATATTGVTVPQVIDTEYRQIAHYQEDNTLQVAVLPQPKLRTSPAQIDTDPGPSLAARAAIVMDVASGAILWEKNPDLQLPIASITKLMTAVVAQDHITNWDEIYTLNWGEISLGGATFAGGVGDTFTKSDLLKAALVGSANNAAAALAHSTGLPEDQFVAAMNAKAQQLGMSQSSFVEPTGLATGDAASARDIAILMRTITGYERLLEPMSQAEHRMVKRGPDGQPLSDSSDIVVRTTNRLIKNADPLMVAGKTGFTYEAGNCLVSLARNKSGHAVIVVVLGAPDETTRFTENHDLAQWAYDHYNWP
jgi:D-alanyl-D-alanine endopeptidase (penicillin-binding protein 7)